MRSTSHRKNLITWRRGARVELSTEDSKLVTDPFTLNHKHSFKLQLYFMAGVNGPQGGEVGVGQSALPNSDGYTETFTFDTPLCQN